MLLLLLLGGVAGAFSISFWNASREGALYISSNYSLFGLEAMRATMKIGDVNTILI